MDGLQVLQSILKNDKTTKEVSEELNLAVGTVKRWLELKNVPPMYLFDLMKMANIEIDYSKFTAKEKDQFFTPTNTAKYCVDKFFQTLKELGEDKDDFIFIEPSAGDGSFLHHLPEKNTFAIDIEPRNDRIHQKDFLSFVPPQNDRKIAVIGNPPFGLRGNLALRFINHSYDFAEYVCFILPQLFESDGKGSPRKRVKGYNLYHSENLDTNFFDPEGKKIPVNVIYQIWSKRHSNKKYLISDSKNDNIKIYSLSLGGTPSTTRNEKMIGKCDLYLPSTCFGKEKMKAYDSFDELPGKKGYGVVFMSNKHTLKEKSFKLDWAQEAFLSTNSALNLRTSMINDALGKL